MSGKVKAFAGNPARKARYYVGPRLPPPEARRQLRTAIIKALGDAPGPIPVAKVWALVGAPDEHSELVPEILDDLVEQRLVETRRVHGTRIHYHLTAKEG